MIALSLFFALSIKSVSADIGKTQIYFGAFVGPSHHGTLAQLEAFETEIGKGVSIWSWFQYWDRLKDSENSPYFEATWMDECRAHGSIPMITWDPGDGGEQMYSYLPLIIKGDYDSYITTWAEAARDWGHPFFIRLFHEFDNGYTTEQESQFVQAWIHVHNIFSSVGATNVNWIWSPSYDIKSFSALYPGSSYVDWTGMAGYNWGDATTFNQMFYGLYNDILSIAPNKPIMIVEIGFCDSVYKAGLFTDMLSTQLPNNYPNVKAFVYWEGPVGGSGSTTALLVKANSNALAAFRQGIASSYYNSNVYSSLNFIPSIVSGSSNPAPSQTENNQASSRAAFAVVAVLATSAIAVSAGLIAYFRKRRKMLDPSTAF